MDQSDVRQIALSLPEAEEATHWGKASFRVRKKIFTIIQSDLRTITVKTTSEEREIYTRANPETYSITESFANMNYMHINLDTAPDEEVITLIQSAWCNVAPKKLVKEFVSNQNT